MFRACGTPEHLRRPGADKILALRARRQTAGSDLRLARLQSEQLSKNQTGPAEEISWFCLGVNEAGRAAFRVLRRRAEVVTVWLAPGVAPESGNQLRACDRPVAWRFGNLRPCPLTYERGSIVATTHTWGSQNTAESTIYHGVQPHARRRRWTSAKSATMTQPCSTGHAS